MKSRKGFTLIELMVVILIVGILAAVSVPIMRGRIDAAKWSEGKAMAGSLATSIRAYAAEQGSIGYKNPTLIQMGFADTDLQGTYFDSTNYAWTSSYAGALPSSPVLNYTITITAPAGINTPSKVTLDQSGKWTETP